MGRRNNLVLNVEGMIGSDARDVAADLVALAQRLQIMVECRANGVIMRASPGMTADEVYRDWWVWIEREAANAPPQPS